MLNDQLKRKIFFYAILVVCFALATTGYILADWQGGTAINNVQTISRSGLIGYWTMDNNDINGVTLYDKSGNGYNGILNNSPTVGVVGKINEAIDFETTNNNYIDLGSNIGSKINDTNNFTISVWVKMESFTDNAGIIGIGNSSARQAWIYTAKIGNQIVFQTEINNTRQGIIVSGYQTDQWYNLAMKYDGTTLTAFINGNPVGTPITAVGSIDSASAYNFIGRILGFDYFDGLIDEVRIYNTSLSNSQISEIYQNTKRNFIQSAPRNGLVGYWNMNSNDINGTTLYDKSGNSYDGIMYNMPITNVIGVNKEAITLTSANTEYIDLPDTVGTSIPSTNQFTMSVWAKMNSFNNNGGIIGVGSSGSRQVWAYTVTSGNGLTFVSNTDGSSTAINLTGFSTDTWYYIVFYGDTSSGSATVEVYNKDGILVQSGTDATFTGNIVSGTTNNFIGRIHQFGYFDGTIDELRLYNRRLSSTEIKQIFNSNKNNYIK